MPNAGIDSTGIALPEIAIGETLANNDNCVNVNGVGDAVGCIYRVALKPGNTLFGNAMIKIPFK
jgi:hypothetical protein